MPCFAVLDGVTDVRNFGAVARSAECFGINGIVIGTKNAAPINEEAVKASAGALLRVPVCRENNLETALNLMRESGLALYGITEKGHKSLDQLDFSVPVALVLGAEDEGISGELTALLNEAAYIPMKGQIQSLNVSVAAGIAFYELAK